MAFIRDRNKKCSYAWKKNRKKGELEERLESDFYFIMDFLLSTGYVRFLCDTKLKQKNSIY